MEPNDEGIVDGGTVAPSKVVINGVEYDPTEAQDFIETGRKTRELEKQYNTQLDKVWPEYGRTTQTLKATQSELEKARQQLSQYEAKKDAGVETAGDVEKAREAARKLNIVLREDLDKDGYVKRTDLDKYLDEREQQREAVRKVLSSADSLEKEIDGTDGRPRFVKKQVLAYANAYGFSDLKAAYEDMHADTLKGWQQEQINAKKSPGLRTLKGQPARKEPKPVRITDDNLKESLTEKLYGVRE